MSGLMIVRPYDCLTPYDCLANGRKILWLSDLMIVSQLIGVRPYDRLKRKQVYNVG